MTPWNRTLTSSRLHHQPGVFFNGYFEMWEKPLGFLQLDWAGISLSKENDFRIDFMTMYGEIYEFLDAATLVGAREKLIECNFQKFEPTPWRLQWRHPFQLDAFRLGTQDRDRIYLQAG
jgi:hypothetical protein